MLLTQKIPYILQKDLSEEDLKKIFTDTKDVFQYFQNTLNYNFDFNDHLRAIDKEYSENYFLNDYTN